MFRYAQFLNFFSKYNDIHKEKKYCWRETFLCFKFLIGVWSEGQEGARMTKEDVDNASGGEQECWFGEGGCLE